MPARLLCPLEFSSYKYWRVLLFLSLEDLLNPGIEPQSPKLQADSLLSELPGKPIYIHIFTQIHFSDKQYFPRYKFTCKTSPSHSVDSLLQFRASCLSFSLGPLLFIPSQVILLPEKLADNIMYTQHKHLPHITTSRHKMT